MKPSDCLKTHTPRIGDYVMTWNMSIGVLLDTPFTIQDNGYTMHSVYNINNQEIDTYYPNDIMPVKEEYMEYSLNLTPKMRDRIYKLSARFENNDEYDANALYIAELELLDDVVNRNLTREVQNVIFADGIDKVIGREKGKGIRIIKLKNGQIWKAHRIKNKYKPLSKKIAKQYGNGSRCINHTTHYELICQL